MAQGLYLSQKMSLQQVLAPQLQQSLALLQAPTLELKALVEQELQQNPLLEEEPPAEQDHEEKVMRDADTAIIARGDTQTLQQADPAEPPSDVKFDPASERQSSEPVDDFQAEFEKLTQIEEWRDHFSATNLPARSSLEDDEKRQFMFDSLTTGTSLQEHLLEQVRLSEITEEQRPIAEMLVGNIDDYGYLKATVEELSFSTAIPKEKIEEVLRIVQTFYPVGVGARNLRECLLLQFERSGRQDTLECRIVRDHMEALGKRRLPEIARATGEDVIDVQDAVARIGLMEPRPGRAFLPDNDQYVVPEVFVTKVGDEYVVTNNNDQVPHLRISNTYKDLMAQNDASSEVREYIREKIRAGKFLIKSLHQRQQTILNIAREIVNRQRDFLERGVAGLKPLTMIQVAEVVGVHETTVSRAVSGKYMQTPQGLFEMKYFFTSGIQTASGEGMSNTSVKEIITEIFKNEESSKPLSDQEVVLMLAEKGIVIARRTVAKYRSELNILPSNLRKVY
ncbi:MAG TPA: RNA polymerase factor sigma-54 [Verrucomicrobiae bacterium]|nr:RNA polymerase factor sigma-54 [Verrucomicrobiae bacterium]